MLRYQEQFFNGVLAAGLATGDELREYRSNLPHLTERTTAEAVATWFVQRNWLTPFQANEILHERSTPLVLNDYLILDLLGRGGMGVVFRAQHRRMERVVALKLIASHLTQEVAIKRFEREVKAAAKLSHPNIVATYDAGLFKGHHYLVMEFVDGEDLDRLSERCTLPPVQAINLMAQAAAGLEYAHASGVIHRDIKPANLFLDKQGRLRILDMGIARIDQKTYSDDGLTKTGMLMGSVDYMAPEQAYDIRNVDGRCDVYSLGSTLYRVLTRKLMYDGDTFLEKARRHERDPIPLLNESCPGATPELQAVFERMVAKLPQDRYPNMTALRTALLDLEHRLRAATASAGWFGYWGKNDPAQKQMAGGSGAPLPLPDRAKTWVGMPPPAQPTTPGRQLETETPAARSRGTTSADLKPKTAVETADEPPEPSSRSYELPRPRSWVGPAASAVGVLGLIIAFMFVSLPRGARPDGDKSPDRVESMPESPDPPSTSTDLEKIRAALYDVEELYREITPELKAIFNKNTAISALYRETQRDALAAENIPPARVHAAVVPLVAKAAQVRSWTLAAGGVLEKANVVKTEIAKHTHSKLFAHSRKLAESALEQLSVGNDASAAESTAAAAQESYQQAAASYELREQVLRLQHKSVSDDYAKARQLNKHFRDGSKTMADADDHLIAGKYDEANTDYQEALSQINLADVEINAELAKKKNKSVAPPPKTKITPKTTPSK